METRERGEGTEVLVSIPFVVFSFLYPTPSPPPPLRSPERLLGPRESTGIELFCKTQQWFRLNLWASLLYNSKDTKHDEFGGVKMHLRGKRVTSAC